MGVTPAATPADHGVDVALNLLSLHMIRNCLDRPIGRGRGVQERW